METCDQCGGQIANIRGRYPDAPERKVCPTCLVESMEHLVQNYPTVMHKEDSDALTEETS